MVQSRLVRKALSIRPLTIEGCIFDEVFRMNESKGAKGT